MKPIKHSIRKQMIAIFVGLVVCMLLVLLIINVRFLGPYYIQNKEHRFVEMYEDITDFLGQGGSISERDKADLDYMAEKFNFSYVVFSQMEKKEYSNLHDSSLLGQQLIGFLLDKQHGIKVLEVTEDYQIVQFRDKINHTEYLAMWGDAGAGYSFLIESPVESIEESVVLSNRFLIMVGAVVIVICILLVWYFSRRLTEPVMELACLSAKMADLDFEAKYTGGGENEIGVLGDNFNRMSEKLEHTISELKNANYQLQKDIEKKEKLEEMRNEFLGNVSHELKTPIALIQGYAEGLKEGISDDPESREFYCDVIMDEAAKMNQMVKNLLTLNQLEFGTEDVEFERIDLTALISGVLQSMEILIQQKEAKVQFDRKESIYVWADEFKTEQVVRNYLSNALNHLDGDKVIDVKIHLEEEKAKVTVFNTGKPIPEEDLGHIWDKFYKVDKAHTREYGGNGIGLSIVKAILESFHQNYGVNNYDNGVEFWFELDRK